MTTALDLITTALCEARVFDPGETIPPGDSIYALARMNSMLDSWSVDKLMIYALLQESKALTTSVGSYTIGSGGAWNTTRPTKIVDPCFIRDSANADHEVDIIDAVAYGNLGFKSSDGAYPFALFYDEAFVSGLGTIYLYPKPAASLTLYINSWKQLQQFTDLTTTISLPPGYQLAIEMNLAILLGPGYGKTPTAELKDIARTSKASLKKVNASIGTLQMPAMPGVSRRSSILTG